MRYGIIGFDGRLGSEVAALFEEKGHSLVFNYSIDSEQQEGMPEVLIDCSLPEAFDKTMELAGIFKCPLIMATTGLADSHFQKLHELAFNIPVVQSFNFSVGIQVLLKLVRDAKDVVPDWDVEISETHHRYKKDKPSGTAIMIQNIFEGQEINTTSLRLGNVAGDHSISFGGLGEILSINHRALSRRTFAEGILKSAEFVQEADPGFYNFTDILFGSKRNIHWK